MANKTEDTAKSRRGMILDLDVGESIDFPMSDLQTIRTECSRSGLQYDRKFSTKTNRESRTVTVTRKA
jgi:hypothetical protein